MIAGPELDELLTEETIEQEGINVDFKMPPLANPFAGGFTPEELVYMSIPYNNDTELEFPDFNAINRMDNNED